ncbi:MAG: hypothetical protein VW516_11100, partial [Rhodospirillaceae bacterium]
TGSGRRDRLPRRAGAEQEHEGDEGKKRDEGKKEAATAGHRRPLPRPRTGSNRALARRERGWFERNRKWLVPYFSALFVVGVEVLAAFTKPLPESAHVVLLAFWGFAVQRGVSRQRGTEALEARLAALAARKQLPVETLRDEFAAFQASLRQGDSHDD